MSESTNINRYKELLVRKDSLKKDCEYIWLDYVKTFGILIETLFNLKIECIALKKKITYFQSKLNKNQPINLDEIERNLQIELSEYYETIRKICETKYIKTTSISNIDLLQIKKIYRKIASMIHPDLHPNIFESKDIKELWQKARAAYIANNLAELQDTEFLIMQAVSKNANIADITLENNIDQRIETLQKEITKIITTEPYKYKFILDDSTLIDDKKQRLQEEIDEYTNYQQQLQKELARLQNCCTQSFETEVLN